MDGYLEKWTNCFGGWHRRYFAIEGANFIHYAEKGEPRKGIVYLGVANLMDREGFDFDIDTGSCIIYLRADNQEIKDKWIRGIKIAKLKISQNNSPQAKKISHVKENEEPIYTVGIEQTEVSKSSSKKKMENKISYDGDLSEKVEDLYQHIERLKYNNAQILGVSELKNVFKDTQSRILAIEVLLGEIRGQLFNSQDDKIDYFNENCYIVNEKDIKPREIYQNQADNSSSIKSATKQPEMNYMNLESPLMQVKADADAYYDNDKNGEFRRSASGIQELVYIHQDCFDKIEGKANISSGSDSSFA